MSTNFPDKKLFDFLKKLKKNNNRDWFNAHKDEYLEQHDKMIFLASALLDEMNRHDVIETPTGKKSLHRIYRDIRFSLDKTPYNTHFGGSFRRSTAARRGGYYFHIEPGNSFIGGGFWGPNADDLLRIREDISMNGDELTSILKNKKFKATFGKIWGESLKTAPKGFDKDHPHIELIRMKQFLISKSFTDEEVMAKNFHLKMNNAFKEMRPFFDYMSTALTTNANGESII